MKNTTNNQPTENSISKGTIEDIKDNISMKGHTAWGTSNFN